ncbi:hypothetical protein [Leptospira sp. GIMC2001]|uniref:hypothetical protein n=1 Tax=Leptospira sp. GIMC2001 TaxID=1513297 RepID=UPI00234BB55E|nr:hypothetical protein [Leptospira sp. GIMC2001]WCL50204.1 hypothetical protein O4O04_05125 [Leptospira sp. GIMC2001]
MILVSVWLAPESVYPESKSLGKISFDPKPQEGYFQGWNYYYRDKDTILFATFLVSNLGPGTHNNGVSLYIKHPKLGTYFTTQEYADYDLIAKTGEFGQKSGDNKMEKKGHSFFVTMRTGDLELDLEFNASTQKFPIALSGGDIDLTPFNGFLRADVGFSRVPAKGQIRKSETTIDLNGLGGMEHLNTNLEVYKYSKSWEILRSFSEQGDRLNFGGFTGTDNYPNGFFKRISIVSNKGEEIFSGKVTKIEILKKTHNKFSGYDLPTQQKLTIDGEDSCTATITDTKVIGEINVLENISAVLRFFVRLFFAKPYQIHLNTSVVWDCVNSPIPTQTFKSGIHSYYLVNR